MPYTYNLVHDTKDTTTAAIEEPITPANVKAWLRLEGFTAVGGTELTFTDDDAILDSIIKSVREWFEEATWLCLTSERTRKAVITNLCGGQAIPYGPVKQITAAVDMDGTDILSTIKTDGLDFPEIREPLCEKMVITYTAGYGSTGVAKLPEAIRHDLLRAAGMWYMNRDDVEAARDYTMRMAYQFSKKPGFV